MRANSTAAVRRRKGAPCRRPPGWPALQEIRSPVMRDGPVLETERLILRPPSLDDLDAWAAFAADPEAQQFLGGAQSRHGAWSQILGVAGSWALQGFGMFSVI